MTDILVQRGIVNDCETVAQGTPDTTVNIVAGNILFDNVLTAVAGDSAFDILTGHPSDPSLDRYDVVGLDNTGSPVLVLGTAGAPGPTDLATLATVVSLAQVYVQAGVTTITANAVTDVRAFVQLPEPGQTFAMNFLSSAWSSGDPGTGNCQFDTTNINTITQLLVSYTSASAPQSLKTWLQGGAEGSAPPFIYPMFLRLWSRKDPTKWLVVEVTAFSDQTTYCNLTCRVVASSAGTNSPPISTDALDTILEFAGIVPPNTSPTASNGSAGLSGDVTMTTAATFYDGPNTGAIGASGETLLLTGFATFVGGGAATNKITARITDGTTIFAEAEISTPAISGALGSVALTALVSPSASKTYKITATSTQNGAVMKRDPADNSSGAHVASLIGWTRLA